MCGTSHRVAVNQTCQLWDIMGVASIEVEEAVSFLLYQS